MIITIFGKPRAGKSTLLASVARRNYIKKEKYKKKIYKSKLYKLLKKIKHKKIRDKLISFFFPITFYECVYSTDPTIHHTVPITYEDLGKFKPTPNSLFLLEEAGIGLSNTDWKKLDPLSKRFAAIHGHVFTDILIVSQTVDISKPYRQRSQLMYIAKKIGQFTVLKKINYSVDVDENTHDLVDAYTKIGPIKFLIEVFTNNKKHRWSKLPFEKSRIIYRPAWYPYFNSYVDDFNYPMEDPYKSYLRDLEEVSERDRKERKEEENEENI